MWVIYKKRIARKECDFIENTSLKKYAKLRKDELIHIDDIEENLYPIKESNCDYITMTGKIYKFYYDDFYYQKTPYINKANGYVYVSITCKDGINRNRRLHVLMAKTFLFNPNPQKYKLVGHKDNNKANYDLSNLYWTNTQENTQKAVDEGLINNKIAEDNEASTYIKVIDKETKEIVGVYGSLRECARCVENITLSSISKVYKKKDYKPRIKKYIYSESNKEEYEENIHLKGKRLIENVSSVKNSKVFRMINKKLRYNTIFDNQVAASKICGISQSQISFLLLNGITTPYNGWSFELIDEIDRKDSSAYHNQLMTVDGYTIKNINDNRIIEFNSGQELKDYLGINGHDLKQYIYNNHILMDEWVIVSVGKKELREQKIG